MHTVAKGDVSVLRIAVALIERGERVLRPLSENTRYDLAIDRGEAGLYRIQCKTGRYRGGCVVFNTASSLAHRGGGRRHYAGEVEAFGVFCPELQRAFIIPIERVNGRAAQSLRVEATKSKQTAGIVWADEFEVGKGFGS